MSNMSSNCDFQQRYVLCSIGEEKRFEILNDVGSKEAMVGLELDSDTMKKKIREGKEKE